MTVPHEHQVYLQKKGYLPHGNAALSAEETSLLREYGHWLEALAAGWIRPTTAEQSHFLQVTRGEAEPASRFELVWHKAHLPASARPPAASAEATADWPKLGQLAELRRYADELRQRKEAERAAVLATVQKQLDAIEDKYAADLAEADRAYAELEAEVKDEVLKAGQSLSAGAVQAVYYRGHVTWDSKGLAEFARSHPAIEQFRKVGAPRVAIRFRPRS
jgi:uncharacterized protein YifE (UPF0438 family)